MILNILVPLDGSQLAEAALPGALWFSKLFGARITLLHVIEHNAPASVHGERHLTSETEALDYLKSIAQHFPPGTQTIFHVHREEVSNVARSIAMHAGELVQDLVVMCTHGKSGLRQLMVGNIAQKVISYGSTPVLLVNPAHEEQGIFEQNVRLLVALDDDPEHSCGLELAGMVARRSGANLLLLNVVPKLETLHGQEAAASKLLPAATMALLEIEQEEATTMLSKRAKPWITKGVDVSWQVRRGDPPEQIAKTASDTDASLIVLGTHGKTGMGAFWAGSVAPRMPALTDLPLLLVPTCWSYGEEE
ncbi:MAG TPA: universal stress protein [Anaerolineaceae bacterium]